MSVEAETVSVAAGQAASNDREFVKGLGLTSSTMLVMGSMIGSGIFLVSAEIAREVNSPALLIGWQMMSRQPSKLGCFRVATTFPSTRAKSIDSKPQMKHR